MRAKDFGDTETVTHIHEWVPGIFNEFVEAFLAKGYKKNESISAVGYDHRRYVTDDPNNWLGNTIAIIEELYERNGNEKVIVVTHSMGGRYMLYLCNTQP